MSFQILSGQLLVGLINGSFYALLSLGFAVIFGLLGIINVAQGTFYMLGAFGSWMLLNSFCRRRSQPSSAWRSRRR
jgi:branched-chain amino acid transport system permease protein